MTGHDIVATYKRLAHVHGKRPAAVIVAEWVESVLRSYYQEAGLANGHEHPLTLDGVPVMIDPNLLSDASDRITVVSEVPKSLIPMQINRGYFEALEDTSGEDNYGITMYAKDADE